MFAPPHARARTRSRAHARVQALAASAIGLSEPSPLIKQLPILALFGVACLLTVLVPTITITSWPALIAATILILAATALAAVFARRNVSGAVLIVVPGLDFIVVGVLRFATGESASIFFAMAILPLVWVAAMQGRRHVAYAFLGVVVTLQTPFVLGSTLENNPNELGRGVFAALAYALAAAVVNDLARLAREHLADLRAREQTTRAELEQASAVQRALLPKAAPAAAHYAFAGMCLPSRAIGGDFFDWYDIDNGTAFTVGDVMGKGVGAGIIAATVRAVVRSARNHDDLAVALERTSDCLASDLGDTAVFATLFHARLDTTTGVVRYIDAGHGLSLHVRADGTWERLSSPNLPVGIRSEEPWVPSQLQLQPGDALVSCSDGILDLYDGTVEALAHVASAVHLTSDADGVVARLTALASATSTRDDDVTALVVRRSAA